MDDSIDPLAASRPSFPSLSPSASLRRTCRTRTQTSPKLAAEGDEKSRKAAPPRQQASSPATATAAAAKTATTRWISRTLTRGPTATCKQILPSSERQCRREKRGMASRPGNDKGAAGIAPDGLSAGREGRQFAVANVGNNGRIYLRPSVRPAHQRYPQPNFTFPITPPNTAVMDRWSQSNKEARHVGTDNTTSDAKGKEAAGFQTPPWTPTTISVTPLSGHGGQLGSGMEALHYLGRRRRAISDGSIHEAGVGRNQDSHAFKMALPATHDRDEHRPRTMGNLDTITSAPMLSVNIPSWRLGTPRFTLRGTPMIRGSSYAPTEDIRISSASGLNSSLLSHPSIVHDDNSAQRPAHAPTIPMPSPFEDSQRGDARMSSSQKPGPSAQVVIEPAMFTNLTFKPVCDDRDIVRYSSAGAVTAATPPRLVAEITSPSFLDYELLSDFFLTFRSFLEPSDLLRMLVARLRWALDRDDEVGMIVRVRTFVALRHWILNYFMDDFIAEHSLRVTFCHLLNDFVDELSQDIRSRRVKLKILAELKKCWRRVCAQHWDGDDFDDALGLEVPIAPGGIAGSRDPSLDPATALETLSTKSDGHRAFTASPTPSRQQLNANPRKDVRGTAVVGDFVALDNRPTTPETQATNNSMDQSPASPYSLASMDVISCSFLGKSSKPHGQNATHCAPAPPVSSNALSNASGAIATTPKALVGKRVRPTQAHKRNNSISDSLRERQSDQASCTDQESLPAPVSGGRLVRGNLLPPGHAIVDVHPPELRGHTHRQTTVFQPKRRDCSKDGILGGAMSGHGMRKLLRSVRNALKHKGPGLYSTSQALAVIQPAGPRGATVNRLPGSAVVPQETIRHNGSRPLVRIDLLGAEVAEDFKKAVREEEEEAAAAAAAVASAAAAAAAGRVAEHLGINGVDVVSAEQRPDSAPPPSTVADDSACQMEHIALDAYMQHDGQRPSVDMGITVGSKSIVIVDDTMPTRMAPIHATRGAEKTTADAFDDSYMTGGVDPTPPSTPPLPTFEDRTRPRSSCLDENVARPNMVEHVSSSRVIPDGEILRRTLSLRASQDDMRSTTFATRISGKHGRGSFGQGTRRCHERPRSSQTQRSLNSALRRRLSSLSDANVSPLSRNLDATTLSEERYKDDFPQATMATKPPPRVLRRRPGGDLKAVKHIGDLDRSALRRSQSAGSLVTCAESICSSYMRSARGDSAGRGSGVPSTSGDGGRGDVFSLVHLAEPPKKRELSLLSTNSIRPNMRSSFEIAAEKLAQIPDDEDDGVESALLKLEGKYPAKKPAKLLSIVGHEPHSVEDFVNEVERNDGGILVASKQVISSISSRGSRLTDANGQLTHTELVEADSTLGSPVDGRAPETHLSVRVLSSFFSAGSFDSHCSTPPVEQGLHDEVSKPVSHLWAETSILRGSGDGGSSDELSQRHYQISGTEDARLSFDFIHKTASVEEMRGAKRPSYVVSVTEDAFFLKDDSIDGSELSSDISDQDAENNGQGGNADQDLTEQEEAEIRVGHVFHLDLPTCRVSDEPPTATGPGSFSSRLTLAQALAMSPEEIGAPPQPDAWPQKPLPPTPQLTPVMGCSSEKAGLTAEMTAGDEEPLSAAAQSNVATAPKLSAHLPFILAFDSDVVAQQFTLIEKDALTEIDWRELIEMNWKHFAHNDVRSWVDFLRDIDAQGIDVVIARFNLMVKWAISEIVLTQHVEERARCIIKLIHIAAHCRRYRNFATLAQLTIALSSNEVSRLSSTWELVPEGDLKTLRDLEILVTPSRNFHSMREEMEVGSSDGCIPFVGIYTHDLLYNAQRPSEIANSPTAAPLVNFQKCRMAAAVVKTLLRLLEASTRYNFQPIEGLTERCLWIGALSDTEIRRHSQNLE